MSRWPISLVVELKPIRGWVGGRVDVVSTVERAHEPYANVGRAFSVLGLLQWLYPRCTGTPALRSRLFRRACRCAGTGNGAADASAGSERSTVLAEGVNADRGRAHECW